MWEKDPQEDSFAVSGGVWLTGFHPLHLPEPAPLAKSLCCSHPSLASQMASSGAAPHFSPPSLSPCLRHT